MNPKVLKQAAKRGEYYSSLQSLLGDSSKQMLKSEYFESNEKFKPFSTFVGEHAYEIINSKITFSDVIQTSALKDDLTLLINEYSHKKTLEQYGVNSDNKILFYGHSGCGKTLSALALANKLKKKLFLVNLSTIIDSSLGKTSTNISQIVSDAMSENAIVFFDEFDALAKMRGDQNDHGEMKRVTSAIIQTMDFLNDETIFIAATNYIDLIDKAILRRFSRKISFEMPTKRNLEAYIKKMLIPTNLKIAKTTVSQVAQELEGLSYAEARDAFLIRLKKYIIKETKAGKKSIKNISTDFVKI